MSHLQWTNSHANETSPFIDDTRAPSPPYPAFMQQRNTATPNFDSNIDSSRDTASSSLNPLQPSRDDVPYLQGKREVDRTLSNKSPNRTFRLRLLLVLLVLLIVAAGIALGVYFGVTRSKKSSASPSVASPTSGGQPNSKVLYGGDGTMVTTEDGTRFVYNNSFGGYFAQDPDNPFNNDARAQSWSPPLNQSWQFGKDQIFG
jgi:glucan 1,3-beta-glucosidase